MSYFFKIGVGLSIVLGVANAFAMQVIDGDSLIDGEKRIRLDGIDAPEIFQTCQNQEGKYDCGQKAYMYLKNLLQGKEVNCNCLENKDKYGRFLCECFSGDLVINRQMVKEGWAMVYRSEEYTAEQNEARAHKRGLWQGKFMRPALFRTLERLQQQEYKD